MIQQRFLKFIKILNYIRGNGEIGYPNWVPLRNRGTKIASLAWHLSSMSLKINLPKEEMNNVEVITNVNLKSWYIAYCVLCSFKLIETKRFE